MWICWFYAAVMLIWFCISLEFADVCTYGITLFLCIQLFPFNRLENVYEIEQKCVKNTIYFFENLIPIAKHSIELVRKSAAPMFESFMAATTLASFFNVIHSQRCTAAYTRRFCPSSAFHSQTHAFCLSLYKVEEFFTKIFTILLDRKIYYQITHKIANRFWIPWNIREYTKISSELSKCPSLLEVVNTHFCGS